MKTKKIARWMSILLFPLAAQASVEGDLNGFFSGMGYDGNITSGKAWQGQSAGYITGGSAYLRTQTRTIQLASVTLPSITAGCGGIDAYLGSFSYVSGDEIQAFVKSIMSNAKGYMFDLALSTTVPELKSAKDFIQQLSTQINNSNYSSCQAAQGIVGGLWPKTQTSQQKVCQDISGEKNIFSDWAASRQGCTVGGDQGTVNGGATGVRKDEVITNKNFVWDALAGNSNFSNNKQLKEFAMSLVGTIIFDAAGKKTEPAALITNDDLLSAIMNGGDKTATIYYCDTTDTNCLNIKTQKLTISDSKSMTGMVQTMLENIRAKVAADTTPLSNDEKGFINSTSVPVLKYLTTSASLGLDSSYLMKMSDFIAEDLMMQYLKEIVREIRTTLLTKNYTEPVAEKLRENINRAEELIYKLQTSSAAKQNQLINLERDLTYLQQQVSTNLLTGYQANYQYGVQ